VGRHRGRNAARAGRNGAVAAVWYHKNLRIGIHTSTAGSLERSALKAAELGANTFQIFSASPRTWRAGKPDPYQVKKLKEARERFDLRPLVIHDNYLINLAAEHPTIRAMSIEAFRGEVERALAIGAEYLVAHPGSYGGQGLERGICTLIESMREAIGSLDTTGLTILIENTAGGGTKLGGCLEELKAIGEVAAKFVDAEFGFCLDTCHCLASGYDVSSAAGLRDMVRQADALFGLEHVRVIHANDSKTPAGSHIDRHENIGRGYIGEDGFRRILAHPRLRTKPFILETPHDRDEDGRQDIETLKKLCRRRPTTTSASN
jgi:deoxyribonuclease IV